ncbi:MAG: hypothetical protein IPO86_00295 [Saprospiraceae bacterium]|nr:hypothetical protein [Saprospiraceae bacterium]
MTKHGRRKFIFTSLGILGSGLLGAWIFRRKLVRQMLFTFSDNPTVSVTASPLETEPCVLTSKQVEGPFYLPSPERSNIVEDKMGELLNLRMQVVQYPDCSPISNAVVEIWQADAEGNYSGYPEQISQDEWEMFMLFGKNGEKQSNGEYHVKQVTQTTYLRGLQRTDENGWVNFDTIVPCWYIGRIPHIHFKVFVNNKEWINSQLYFEKNYCDNLFTTKEPYTNMGKCPMDFPNDAVFAMAGGKHNGLLLTPQLTDDNNLSAIVKIGVIKA